MQVDNLTAAIALGLVAGINWAGVSHGRKYSRLIFKVSEEGRKVAAKDVVDAGRALGVVFFAGCRFAPVLLHFLEELLDKGDLPLFCRGEVGALLRFGYCDHTCAGGWGRRATSKAAFHPLVSWQQ